MATFSICMNGSCKCGEIYHSGPCEASLLQQFARGSVRICLQYLAVIRYIKTVMKSSLLHTCRAFLLFVSAILSASPASADVRQDAGSAYLILQQKSAAQKFPDDMKSFELVFEIAERFFMVGEKENADKFYLLALQESLIIETMLKSSEAVVSPAESALPAPSDPQQPVAADPDTKRIIGARGVYTVLRGDTVRLVAAKLGVSQQQLRSMNSLDPTSYLRIGQKLIYNNRKIIPQRVNNGIIVNIPDRTLYFFQRGNLVAALPVALGSPTKNEKYIWQTPVGKFRITAKLKDPTWTVPASIQTEMKEQGKEIFSSVSAGPENPLGKYAIKTTLPGILIHSTTRPSSIYSFSSHGCIRLSPDQMEAFFPQIKVNTKGEIIYKPVKLVLTENGRVFLEVHRDVYNRSAGLAAEARQLVENQKLSESVDWQKFKAVVKQKLGVAEDISM